MDKFWFFLLFFTLFCTFSSSLKAAEPCQLSCASDTCQDKKKQTGKNLSKSEIDQILDNVFKKIQKLKYFRANIVQLKEGGAFKRQIRHSGTIFALLPDKLLLDMSADGLKILVDGTYAWISDLDLEDVERWSLNKRKNGEQGMDLAGLLIGRDVKTAAELHNDFAITGFTAEKKSHRFILKPVTKKLKQKITMLEIVISQDAILPCYVRTVNAQEKGSSLKPLVSTQKLTNIKTNLDGLSNFPDNTFIFNPSPEMTIRDMDAQGGPREIKSNEIIKGRKNREKKDEQN